MPVSGPSVLTWGHRVLGVAVDAGSRLRARVAAMAACGRRPVEQRPAAMTAPSGALQQPPNRPTTVAGPPITTAPQTRGEHTVSTRVATASVTPAMVRRWAPVGPRAGDPGCRSGADPSVGHDAIPRTGGTASARRPPTQPSLLQGRTPFVRPIPLLRRLTPFIFYPLVLS